MKTKTKAWPAGLLLALALGATACGGAAERPRRNALLITLDTTRIDALDCYSGRQGVTPNLSALAAESTVYMWARATAPLTLPSHASMLTGLYPPRHTVRLNSMMALPESASTLAERAEAQGIETAAFVGAVVLARSFQLDQGFETYEEPAPSPVPTRRYASLPAEEVVGKALAWLERRDDDRPFLCWVHLFDAHDPYDPPPDLLAQAGGNPYLGEVARMDRALGRLFDALRERGLYEDTTILVVGDHGEALGDHGEDSHGAFVFDSTLRVPFLLRRAGGGRAAGRSLEIASVADVHPTLAEALGLPPAPGLDGLSLYGGEIDPARGVYFESYEGYLTFGWSPIAGWATRAGKYIHSPAPELYLVEKDPNEAHNVVAEHADALAGYRAGLARVAAEPALPGAEVGGDAEGLMRELRALGYSGAGASNERLPDPLAASERPSPHTRIEAYARFARARELVRQKRGAEAVPLLEELVAEVPLDSSAWFQLGAALLQAGRFEESRAALARNLALQGSWEGVEVNLGFCCEALGRTDEAIEHFARAVEQEPRWTEITQKLIALLEGQNRSDEAERYRAALRAAPASGAPPPAGDG